MRQSEQPSAVTTEERAVSLENNRLVVVISIASAAHGSTAVGKEIIAFQALQAIGQWVKLHPTQELMRRFCSTVAKRKKLLKGRHRWHL